MKRWKKYRMRLHDGKGKKRLGGSKTMKMDMDMTQSLTGYVAWPPLTYAGRSHQGKRGEQQDRILIETRGMCLLAAVCDGMGGMEGGALASETAAALLKKRFAEEECEDGRSFLMEAAEEGDRQVNALSLDGRKLDTGTTLAAVMLKDDRLHWLSVGDSRVYLYREGILLCPVKAHNYRLLLEERLRAGKIDPDRFHREERLPGAEGLISYLGIGGLPRMEINQKAFDVLPGDRILLCSDGLYKSLAEEEIKSLLESDLTTEMKTELLVQAALEKGGRRQDNTSVILIEREVL